MFKMELNYINFWMAKKQDRFYYTWGKKALTESVENAEDDSKLALEEANKILFTNSDVLICIAASGNTPFSLKSIRDS